MTYMGPAVNIMGPLAISESAPAAFAYYCMKYSLKEVRINVRSLYFDKAWRTKDGKTGTLGELLVRLGELSAADSALLNREIERTGSCFFTLAERACAGRTYNMCVHVDGDLVFMHANALHELVLIVLTFDDASVFSDRHFVMSATHSAYDFIDALRANNEQQLGEILRDWLAEPPVGDEGPFRDLLEYARASFG